MQWNHANMRAKEIHITSISLNPEDMELFKSKINDGILKLAFKREISTVIQKTTDLSISKQFCYYNQISETKSQIFINGESSDILSGYKLKGFNNANATEIRWITELSINGHSQVRKPYLISQVFKNPNECSNDIVRISTTGVAYNSTSSFIPADSSIEKCLLNTKIKCVSFKETLDEVFAENNLVYCMSNQGKYLRNILNKFDNNLSEVASFFTQKDYIKIFNTYKNLNKNDKFGILLDGRKRRYLNYDFLKSIINDSTLKNIMNELIAKRILLRGFLIKCPECINADWYSINDVGDNITCTQCNEKLFFSNSMSPFAQTYEPVWFYKLDEVFYKAITNDFDVPLLTLHYLSKTAKKSFDFFPEVDIFQGDKKDAELDIICNVDGDLIIGEAKRPDYIEEKQLNKYQYYASRLGVQKLVFSTLAQDWDNKTKNIINEISKNLNKYGIEVICINSKDLMKRW